MSSTLIVSKYSHASGGIAEVMVGDVGCEERVCECGFWGVSDSDVVDGRDLL